MKTAILAVSVYVLAGFWTFGHTSQMQRCGLIETTTIHPDGSSEMTRSSHYCLPAVYGVFWPLYWGGRLAIEVTK